MLNSFNDYLTDLIVEKLNNGETVLLLSKRLRDRLKTLKDKHPIVNKLLSSENKSDFKTKITYLDLVEDDKGLVSLMNIPKLIDFFVKKKKIKEEDITDEIVKKYNKKNSFVYKKNRVEMKVGKLINKLFPDEFKPSGMPDKDIESFVNLFKSSTTLLKAKFELVKGSDITYYYNRKQYSYSTDSPLFKSCMAKESCENYLDFYAKNYNKVSLLILKDDKYPELIKGRALVWNLSNPEGRTFIDRIYTHHDDDIYLFKEYAETRGWLYKVRQNADHESRIVDTKEDTISMMILTVDGMKPPILVEYPYLDTLIYYDTSYNILSNNVKELPGKESRFVLQNIDGELEPYQIWVEYYKEYFDENDLQWCEMGNVYRKKEDAIYSEFYKVWIAQDYAEENLNWCKEAGEWREEDDSYYLDKYNMNIPSEDIDNYKYSSYSGNHLKPQDAKWSDHYDTYIDADQAIKIWIDADHVDSDWRGRADNTYWINKEDGMPYDNSVDESDFED